MLSQINKLIGATCFVTLTVSNAVAQDKDGCYSARNLTSATAFWAEYTKDKLLVDIRNNGNQGVYVSVCVKRKSGRPDCGASWIRGGGTERFSGLAAHSSGRYQWKAVGSVKRDASWVCSGKYEGWNNTPNL